MNLRSAARIALPFTALTAVAALALAAAPAPQAAAKAEPRAQSGASATAPAASKFAGEDQAAKRADVLKLLEVNGVRKLMASQVDTMMKGFISQAMLPPEGADAMKQVFSENFDKLIELCVQPYMDHLSHEDIKGLIAFSESPLGQRMAAAQPKIMAETTAAGMKWGQQLQPILMQRMQEIQAREQGKGGGDEK
jgi:hypothetical protein